MKTRFVLSLAIAALIAACGGGGASTPSQVAEQYLTALNKMDFDAAKKLGTEKTGQMLDMMAPMMKMMGDAAKKEVGFKILGEKIEGEKATVTYRSDDKEADETLTLIQKDGKWLVDMAKEDNMGDAGADMMNDIDAGMDSAMNAAGDALEAAGEELKNAAQ